MAGIGPGLCSYVCMSTAYAASARAVDTLQSACGAEETDVDKTGSCGGLITLCRCCLIILLAGQSTYD